LDRLLGDHDVVEKGEGKRSLMQGKKRLRGVVLGESQEVLGETRGAELGMMKGRSRESRREGEGQEVGEDAGGLGGGLGELDLGLGGVMKGASKEGFGEGGSVASLGAPAIAGRRARRD